MTEQEAKVEAPKVEAPKAQAPKVQSAPKPQTAKDVLQNLKDKKPEKSKEVATEKEATDVLGALKKAMKEGLPRDSGSAAQSVVEKFRSIGDARREKELQNFENAKRTLEGAIASGDKELVRAALGSFFDLCPESMEIEHAYPSLSAMELRNAQGTDYLIGQALLILCDGSKTNRTQVLETLDTQWKSPLWGYVTFLELNPQFDRISNREGNEKVILSQHMLYDETMSQPERRLLEYLKRRRV